MQGETFTPDLNNPNSTAFKNLERRVTATVDAIYKKRFGRQYDSSFVRRFRSIPRIRTNATQADIGLRFNQSTSITDLPTNTEVAQTLVDAVKNPNNTFNVSINPNTIAVLDGPRPNATSPTAAANTTMGPAANTTMGPAANTTMGPAANTTMGPAATTTMGPAANATMGPAANATMGPAANATMGPAANATAAPTMIAKTTTAPTTAAPTFTTVNVTFRSIQSTFTTDLSNTSSQAFKDRASMIKTQLEPLYQSAFPSSFNTLQILQFRQGSVINEGELSFTGTAPNGTRIAQVLIDATNITGFDIETASILVDGVFSSGVSQKISLVIASFLVGLSWILSSQ